MLRHEPDHSPIRLAFDGVTVAVRVDVAVGGAVAVRVIVAVGMSVTVGVATRVLVDLVLGVAVADGVRVRVGVVVGVWVRVALGVDEGVRVGRGTPQPYRALLMAPRISSTDIRPSWFASPAVQAGDARPSAMFTMASTSSGATTPLREHAPKHGSGGRVDVRVGLDVGVRLGVDVCEGFNTVGVRLGVGVRVGVAVG